MRRLLSLALGAVLSVCAAHAADDDGHLLVSDWRKVEKLTDEDKSREALEVLDQIIVKAQSHKYAWDFYDAWEQKEELSRRMDYRAGMKIREARDSAFAAFGSPVCLYAENCDCSYLKTHEKELKSSCNKGFYPQYDFIKNDFDYILWDYALIVNEKPDWFVVLYDKRFPGIRDLHKRFVSLRAESDRLFHEDVKARERAEALRNGLLALGREIGSLKGEAKLQAKSCCPVDKLLSELSAPSLRYIEIRKDTLTFKTRNVLNVDVTVLKGGRKVYSTRASTKEKVFYVWDKISVDLGFLEDGSYQVYVSSGGVKRTCTVAKYTLECCVFGRGSDVRMAVWNTKTRRFVNVCTFEISRGPLWPDVEKFDAAAGADGFFRIPSDVFERVKSWERPFVEAGVKDGKSALQSSLRRINFSEYMFYSDPDDIRAAVLFDRGAYHPGDTVRFKTVVTKKDGVAALESLSCRVYMGGRRTTGHALDSVSVKTSASGSADSYYVIPRDAKGGEYMLKVSARGRNIGSEGFRVDEFVLPEMICEFDKNRSLLFTGDSIAVTGRISRFDGHALALDSIRFTLFNTGVATVDCPVRIESDGRFSIPMQLPQQPNVLSGLLEYTSKSGYTSGQPHFIGSVVQRPSLEVQVRDALYSNLNVYVVDRDTVVLNVGVKAGNDVVYQGDVSYELIRRADSVVVSRGCCPCGDLKIPITSVAGGYRLTLDIAVSDGRGTVRTGKKMLLLNRYVPGSDMPYPWADDLLIGGFAGKDVLDLDMGLRCTAPDALLVVSSVKTGEVLYSGKITVPVETYHLMRTCRVRIPCPAQDDSDVQFMVLYERDGELRSSRRNFKRPDDVIEAESSFVDIAPRVGVNSQQTISFKGAPGTEAAVAVYDISMDRIKDNTWAVEVEEEPIPFQLSTQYVEDNLTLDEEVVCGRIFGAAGNSYVAGLALKNAMDLSQAIARNIGSAATICWKPVLLPDKDGVYTFSFCSGDKTGTYAVQAYIHDVTTGRSGVIRDQMQVFVPVQLSVQQPQVLYSGDRCEVGVVLSNSGEACSGDIVMNVDGVGQWSESFSAEAGQSVTARFPVDVPVLGDAAGGVLKFKVFALAGEGVSGGTADAADAEPEVLDAIAFDVPVLPAKQVVTESHSVFCKDGEPEEQVMAALNAAFDKAGNMSPYGAQYSESRAADRIMALLERAAAEHSQAADSEGGVRTSLEVADAMCAGYMLGNLSGTGCDSTVAGFRKDLSQFRGSDGGYAWIKGMGSSAFITAMILEHTAVAGVPADTTVAAAVDFLDCKAAGDGFWAPYYLYVRSMYPEYPLSKKAVLALKTRQGKVFSKELSDFVCKSDAKAPVFDKVMRMAVIRRMAEDKDVRSLLGGLGVKAGGAALKKSYDKGMASLKQYCSHEPMGVVYCPNLVMPFRGMLGSEAYWHSVMADLMDGYDAELSRGMRHWLVLQEDTQKWGGSFAFVTAVRSVLALGDTQLAGLRIATLTKRAEMDFGQVKATGNGMGLQAAWFVMGQDGKNHPLMPGDSLCVGDRVKVEYTLSSDSNRSFVRVEMPYHACLRPVQQLSGGRFLRYREVRKDKVVYWYEVFPEFEHKVGDEFFVTQAGVFQAPAATAECLFNHAYRATATAPAVLSPLQH